MFRLSKITDYGIVILAHLAGEEADAAKAGEARPLPSGHELHDLHSAREVAAAVHLPLPVVSKVLKGLARHGVLESHRGAKGGFSLARDPREITVEEMVAALQGPVALTECASAAPVCSIEGHCPVRDPWQVINRVVQVALSKITLADLIDPSFTSSGTTLQILSRAPQAPLTTSHPATPSTPAATAASATADPERRTR